MRDHHDDPTSDLLLGALAGAAGVWAMDRLDWFLTSKQSAAARAQTEAARPGGRDPAHELVHRAARAVGVRPDSPRDNAAGRLTHYAIGIAPAAAYGLLRDRVPLLGAFGGLLFGGLLSLVEDEVGNPALGLAAPARRYPFTTHARGVLSHLLYGVATDLTFRVLRGVRRLV